MQVIYDKSGGYTGCLGNIMFQTASSIGITIKNNMYCCFPTKPELSYFNGAIPQSDSLKQIQTIDYNEPNFHYNEVVLDSTKNWNLKGYFQSECYWKHCENTIKEIFTFNDSITDYVKAKYYKLLSNTNKLVSLHVRRGDYLKLQDFHPVLPLEYYINASKKIQEIIKNPITFVIFSDDLNWCKENLTESVLGGQVFYAENNSPIQDMYLMSLCDHNVIANSSFSWWASYLNKNFNKIGIAPKNWFGKNYVMNDTKDLYLKSWILM